MSSRRRLRHPRLSPVVYCLVLGSWLPSTCCGQHDHEHVAETTTTLAKPRVFLDKSPRIVDYQLKRLDNQRLLLVDRQTDSPRYAPVYRAILLRAGMSPQYRHEALEGLVTIHQSSAPREIIAGLATLDAGDGQQRRTADELAALLFMDDAVSLEASLKIFTEATQSSHALVRRLGYAALVAAERGPQAFEIAATRGETMELLRAIALVPKVETRNLLRNQLVSFLHDEHPQDTRLAAMEALRFTTADQEDTFRQLASFVAIEAYRATAVDTLLGIPQDQRDATIAENLLSTLVTLAEATPAETRTSDAFLNSMQLADQLLARVPVELARTLRQRIQAVAVRVVMIHTVEEEMRYDVPYFAVEAGKPVQVILKNHDLMPHNLVVVMPGSLQEIAERGLEAGPQGHQGKEYVPADDRVLWATHLVASGKQARLTFRAPEAAGEYPYVCTFPRHWMRMYGVMVVVPDLDTWLAAPVPPQDPLGSSRAFVNRWTLADFEDGLERGVQGRSSDIGRRIFQEATCSQCHQVHAVGGAVGPDLTQVFERWKGDRVAILREMLVPSHRIDPQYAMQLVMTVDGNTVSGIVAAEGKDSVSLLTNPESQELTVIPRKQIDEMVTTATSMMPKGLLDRFTKDEIFELLAFLESLHQGPGAP